MVVSLHAALARILDEGLPAVWARHADAGRRLQEGLEDLGLELFAAEGWRLPELTTVKVPDGVDSAAVRRYLLDVHGLEIGAGAGAYASTVWRIGLMGHNARPDAALLCSRRWRTRWLRPAEAAAATPPTISTSSSRVGPGAYAGRQPPAYTSRAIGSAARSDAGSAAIER